MRNLMLAIVVLVSCGKSREQRMFGGSTEKTAKLAVDDYAFNAYGAWSQANPSKACPDQLSDLGEYVTKKDTRDPWGTEYRLLCGPSLPSGVKGGIAVESAGPDQKFGTGDDVKSY
jgi:hypothetical protein